MQRNGRTSLILALVATLAALALLLWFAPWRDGPGGDFRVLAIEPEGRPLARNEPILVRFDRPVHPETPVEALIRVSGPDARRLPIEIVRQGATLAIEAAAPSGWPAKTTVTLGISPGVAVPFRARDHAVLDGRVERALPVGDDYLDFGLSFRLALERPQTLVAIPRGTVFRFTADPPIDPASLGRGRPAVSITVLGGDRGQKSFAPRTELAGDGRELVVTPWPEAAGFEPGLEHRLTVHAGRLRSVTQRALERDLVVEFRTARTEAFEGQLDLGFGRADLDPASRQALGDEALWALPVLTLFSSVELGAKEDQEEIAPGLPGIFGPRPNRLQILVPGSHLGDEPGLVTGFSFFAGADPADPAFVLHRDIILPRVVFRLGESPRGLGGGLLPLAALNFAEPGPSETVAEGSREGELILARRERRGAYGEWIDVAFERPFVYRGGARDLVFELVNDGGAFALDGGDLPEGWEGPLWTRSSSRRVNPGQDDLSLPLPGRLGEITSGIPSRAIFATKIHIERYQEIVTRWYEVAARDPLWFRVPAEDQIDAEGAEGRDFVIDFQGEDRDGRTTEWGRLEDLSGCRRIRARLRFQPDADWRIAGVEVRRLRLRYRDGR